jgi:putative flippase GtrA
MNDEVLIIKTRKSISQLFRYALVGFLSNVAGYLVYLALTYIGGTPKVIMTVLYVVGAAVGFFGNRNLTFEYEGSIMRAGGRYIIAHGAGYTINLSILILFVDKLGYAHQWVQAVAIFIVAAFLFLAFKVFVFPVTNESIGEGR